MRYRKKPVVIEAVQYDGNFRCLDIFSINDVGKFIIGYEDDGSPYLIIPTLEGGHKCSKGDYVIRGVKGEYYPCKPDIFEMTYERDEPIIIQAPIKNYDAWDEVIDQLGDSNKMIDHIGDANEMVNHVPAVGKMVFPKDINGVVVKVGDKVQGIGSLKFHDEFEIDRTPIVTANIQNGKLYFGNLSAESFTLGFKIVESKMVEDGAAPIDWLINQLENHIVLSAHGKLGTNRTGDYRIGLRKAIDFCHQAKEMESKETLYTEEQVRDAIDMARSQSGYASYEFKENEIIQSLKQPKQ